MSYERTGMGTEGQTSTALREILYARGHAVRSRQQCSAEQYESWLRLGQALRLAPGISDPPGTEAYQATLANVTHTYNETNRRCKGQWAFGPAEDESWQPGEGEGEGGAPGGGDIEEPTSSFLFVGIGLATILGIGGLSYFLMKKKGKKRAVA